MQTSPQSLARQVGWRIADAGIKVPRTDGRGLNASGRPCAAFEAESAMLTLSLGCGLAACRAVGAQLAAAGAVSVRSGAACGPGSTLTLVVTDDTAGPVTSTRIAVTAGPRACVICDRPVPAGYKKTCGGAACSAELTRRGRKVRMS